MAKDSFKIDKGITLKPQSAPPSDPVNGEIYYDSTLGFQRYEAGAWGAFSGSSAITVKEEGTTQSTSVTSLNFVGAEITAAVVGAQANVTVESRAIKWSTVTGTSQTIATGNGYIADNASQINFTLPATAAVGTVFAIAGKGLGGWRINQNSGQYIVKDTQTTGVGALGFLESAHYRTCVTLVCTIADTEFEVINSQGAITSMSWSFQGSTYSYWMGGVALTGPLNYNTANRLVHAGESISVIGSTMAAAKYAGSNGISITKGYFLGGNNSGALSTITGFTFGTQTFADISATLSNARERAGGATSSAKCYAAGGNQYLSSIEALTFTGESIATLGATLSSAKRYADSSVSAPLKGYFFGGDNGSTTSTIDALVFSGETNGAIAATLSAAKYQGAGAGSTTIGYFFGGDTSNASSAGAVTTIEKLIYSTEVRSTLSSTISVARQDVSGSSGTTKAFVAGGDNTAGLPVSTIDGMPYSTETSAALSVSLDASKSFTVAVQV